MKMIQFSKKEVIFHIIIFLFLIIYLLSANFLFDKFFLVNRESKIKNIDVPDVSNNIQYNVDVLENEKSGWKELFAIRGWAVIEGQNTENTSTYLVLDNTTARYIFTTTIIERPDVTDLLNKNFNRELNLNNSGFEANIPIVYIDNNRYQLGILVENQTSRIYTLTDLYCTNGNCSVINSVSEKKQSQIVNKKLSGPSEDIHYHIDSINSTKLGLNEILTILGWGFIMGQNSEATTTYVVLNNSTVQHVFSTTVSERPDVTEFFNENSTSVLNLNRSGFEANIPIVYIDNNLYQLGLLIENQTSQKYILTNTYCMNGNCSTIDMRTGS